MHPGGIRRARSCANATLPGRLQRTCASSRPYAGLEGHAPEYETLAGFGGNCLNADLDSIITANERCNRLGLDTISSSAAIAFAFAASERGLIGPELAGDLDLSWGSAETIPAMVDQIAAGEGLGRLLGQGGGGRAGAWARLRAYDPRQDGSVHARGGVDMAATTPRTRGACTLVDLRAMWQPMALPPRPYNHTQPGKGRFGRPVAELHDRLNAVGIFKPGGETTSNRGRSSWIGRLRLGHHGPEPVRGRRGHLTAA